MKNISFLQLVLGVGGALLIYSGVKDLNAVGFLGTLVKSPATAFSQGGYFSGNTAVQHSSNTNPTNPPSSDGVQHI